MIPRPVAVALSVSIASTAPISARAAGEAASASEASEADEAGDASGPRKASEVPAWVLWRDYVRVEPPANDGKMLLIVAAVGFGVGGLFQLGDMALNDNGSTGLVERVFMGSAMILAPIGAHQRGRYDAFMDTAIGRRRRATTPWIGSGLALAGIGAASGIANEVLWWRCQVGETGPYVIEPPDPNLFSPGEPCRSTISRLILDGSALMVASGLAMAMWGIRYRRDMRSYERAVIAVVPGVGVDRLGIGLAGRF